MKTKRVAIEQLSGAALSYAVGKVEGRDFWIATGNRPEHLLRDKVSRESWHPVGNWIQCGPLIERYKIDLSYHEEYVADDGKGPVWEAMLSSEWLAPADEYDPIGKTPLIAACRAIVAARNPSGYVEVPDELVEGE